MTEKIEDICRLLAYPNTQINEKKRFAIEQKLAFESGIKCLKSGINLLSTQKFFSDDVFSILINWVEGKPDLWTRSIGHLNRAISADDIEYTVAAIVVLAISASESGVEGCWQFESPKPFFIRVGDFVLFSVRSGRVESKNSVFWAEFNCGEMTVQLSRHSHGKMEIRSACDKKSHIISPRIDTYSHHVHIVPSVLASPELLIIDSGPKSKFEDNLVNIDVSEQLTIALRQLLKLDSDTHHWVSSVIKEVIPITSIKGSVGSSSCTWDCSTIAMTVSNLENPLLLLEMLVHEASHQHFFLVKLLGSIDDGTDKREYHSPMMGMNRPIEKILLAYHAVINMLSLYYDIREQQSTEFDEFIDKRVKILIDKASTLDHMMLQTNSFTPIGNALWSVLREKESLLLSRFQQNR